jgi:hypothetical protein
MRRNPKLVWSVWMCNIVWSMGQYFSDLWFRIGQSTVAILD